MPCPKKAFICPVSWSDSAGFAPKPHGLSRPTRLLHPERGIATNRICKQASQFAVRVISEFTRGVENDDRSPVGIKSWPMRHLTLIRIAGPRGEGAKRLAHLSVSTVVDGDALALNDGNGV